MSLHDVLPGVVYTTSRESADKKGRLWIRFMPSRVPVHGRHYVFTDGSSLGGCAAALLSPVASASELTWTSSTASEWSPPTKTRNVGAEWRGLLLGLKLAPARAHLTIVCDLLWVHAQLIGVRKTHDPETKLQLAEAHELLAARDLRSLTLVHHEGHQSDGTVFSYWNNEADRLCGEANKAAKEAKVKR